MKSMFKILNKKSYFFLFFSFNLCGVCLCAGRENRMIGLAMSAPVELLAWNVIHLLGDVNQASTK